MVGDNQKTKEEIKRIKNELLMLEEGDIFYLNKELKELRNLIIYVHFKIEKSLEMILLKNLLYTTDQSDSSYLILCQKMEPLLEKVNFFHKLEACFKRELITKQLYSKISTVNNHRTTFSHPANNLIKILHYREQELYLQTLKLLLNTSDDMIEHMRNLDKYLSAAHEHDLIFSDVDDQ